MIEVKKLVRKFGAFTAVNNVSFDVDKGEVLGFLGPNGAGKTTTMRIITGYIEPSSGTVRVGGHDIAKDAESAKSLIGYLPENAPLYRDMDVSGFLRFAAAIRGLKGRVATEAIDRVIEICHLDSVFHQSIDTLSKGYTRRTVLAQAILHDPPVLILDEPTDGLDPNQKFEVRNLINKMAKDKAIIISTHILEEVEACCTRAIVIAKGSLVANGTPASLKGMSENANTILAAVSGISLDALREILSGTGKVLKTVCIGGNPAADEIKIRIVPSSGSGLHVSEIVSLLTSKGIKIHEICLDGGRLDEVFRQITIKDQEGLCA